MTNEKTKKIKNVVNEAEKSLLNKALILERVKQIVAIEEKLYGKMAKLRRTVSLVVGAASGIFTGVEYMQIYNLFYDSSLVALYNQNTAEINQMKIDLWSSGVDPDTVQLPVFSDSVKEQLVNFGIDTKASSSQVILNAMSKGILDFSTLDASNCLQIGALVVLSAVFAGFEINNFLKNRVRYQEGKKIAKGELPTFLQEEEEKNAKNEKNQTETKKEEDFQL